MKHRDDFSLSPNRAGAGPKPSGPSALTPSPGQTRAEWIQTLRRRYLEGTLDADLVPDDVEIPLALLEELIPNSRRRARPRHTATLTADSPPKGEGRRGPKT